MNFTPITRLQLGSLLRSNGSASAVEVGHDFTAEHFQEMMQLPKGTQLVRLRFLSWLSRLQEEHKRQIWLTARAIAGLVLVFR